MNFATLLETHPEALFQLWLNGVRPHEHEGASSPTRLREQLAPLMRSLVSSLRRGSIAGNDGLDLAEEARLSISQVDMRVFTDFMSALVAEGVAFHARAQLDSARVTEGRLHRLLGATVAGTWQLDLATQTIQADAAVRALHLFPLEGPVTFQAALAVVHPRDLPA